ncbi:MAG: SpoIIE family protein phosphatase [Spirochaetia bacterium]|nr:SpoIIE family protein phosphatase [Spirochaetia bacterium]
MESILENIEKKLDDSGLEYLKINPDTLRSINYILKTASNLSKAKDARFVVLDKLQKQYIIGFNKIPLNKTERILIAKTMKKNHSMIFSPGEAVSASNTDEFVVDNSYIVCPLRFHDQETVIGVLLVKSKLYANDFSSDDKNLIDTLVNYFLRLWKISFEDKNNEHLILRFSKSLQILTEKMELIRENIEAKQLIGEIIRVSKLINSTLDIDALLESIMESAKLVIKSEGCSLLLIDEKSNELYFNIVSGEKEEEVKQVRIPLGTGIAGIVAQSRQPMIVNDAQSDPRLFKKVDEKAAFITRNLIACPLMVRDKIIGVLEVINSVGRKEFSGDDLELFITFSEQAAIAIHNRELIQSLQKTNLELSKKVHELSSLHEVSKVLISNINEKELFDALIKIISEVLEVNKASIMIYREKINKLELISYVGFSVEESEDVHSNLDDTIAGIAFKENRVIQTEDLVKYPFSQYQKSDRYFSKTCIVYPLASDISKYGVLSISDKKFSDSINIDDVQLVSTIAGQITKAIENFRLLDEMIEKKSFERELEITSSIQQSILPTKPVISPLFDLGFIAKPAKVMGGDFYDFEAFSDGDFAFLIADVSGKSLPAALFMAITSSIIKTLLQDYRKPGDLLHRANELVYKNSHSGMFVTLFYLHMDSTKNILNFASAGHNEQFIYRQNSDEFIFLVAKGRPLGVSSAKSHGPFSENSIQYEENDLVVLYTDGIVEAINEKKEEFGIDRFKALIKKLCHLNVQKMTEEIFREITKFAGNEPQFDDFTLLLLKMNAVKV